MHRVLFNLNNSNSNSVDPDFSPLKKKRDNTQAIGLQGWVQMQMPILLTEMMKTRNSRSRTFITAEMRINFSKSATKINSHLHFCSLWGLRIRIQTRTQCKTRTLILVKLLKETPRSKRTLTIWRISMGLCNISTRSFANMRCWE
jgi:hypothetical protein